MLLQLLLIFLSFFLTAQTTRTVCSSGCDHTTIQAAVNAAACGDTIEIEAGETFTENVVLTFKSGCSSYITLQSSALGSLPAAGTRVDPADAANMPKIQSTAAGSTTTFSTTSGASPSRYYKLVGLEITRFSGSGSQTSVIELGTTGSSQDTLGETPTNIIIDRCYIHGRDEVATRRGILLQAQNVQIINSYLENFWDSGADSQAILSTNGAINLVIGNNFLQGAGENYMFGGGDPSAEALVPQNILIEHNHFHKPLSWDGEGRGVKNLFELKNAKDVTIRYNIFENVWGEAQSGHAIVFTPANQDGTAPYTTVQDVAFEWNIVKQTGSPITIMMKDTGGDSVTMTNVTVRQNLFITDPSGNGHGNIFILDGGADSGDPGDGITLDHNTFVWESAGVNRLAFEEGPNFVTNFSFTNNILAFTGGSWGGITSDVGGGTSGTTALDNALDVYTFSHNVIQGSATGNPGSPNQYAANLAAFAFTDSGAGDFSLSGSSPYLNDASDGSDPGVDWAILTTCTENTEAGTNYVTGTACEGDEPQSGTVKGRVGGTVRLGGNVRL